MRIVPRVLALTLLALGAACADATAPRPAADANGAAPALDQFTGITLTVQRYVQAYETCISIAEPIGGEGPFAYEWFINGVSVGAGQYPGNLYWTNDGTSHTVGVVVTETSTSISYSASEYVRVGPSDPINYPHCLQ
jgi:hypothetical protein